MWLYAVTPQQAKSYRKIQYVMANDFSRRPYIKKKRYLAAFKGCLDIEGSYKECDYKNDETIFFICLRKGSPNFF